jgi:hypothetical protein
MIDSSTSHQPSRRGIEDRGGQNHVQRRRQLTTLLAALWLTAPLIGAAQSEPSQGTISDQSEGAQVVDDAPYGREDKLLKAIDVGTQ